MNIAEAAHITSTMRPPRTPQSARTSQYHAFGSSACFDTGFTVEAQRREEYSIDVRLCNVTTTVRPRTPLKPLAPHRSMPSAALLVLSRGSRWKHSGGKVPDVHPISRVMECATINSKTPLLASSLGVNYWYFYTFPYMLIL